MDAFLSGGSNESRFVQVMKGHGIDQARMREMDDVFAPHAPSFRPDVLGGIRVWTGTDSYIEVAYFTSEADAREGEKKEPPAELAGQMGDFEELMANVEFVDLTDPWLY